MELKIDTEFEELIQPLTKKEFQGIRKIGSLVLSEPYSSLCFSGGVNSGLYVTKLGIAQYNSINIII